MELRYVRLNEELLQSLAELRMRHSLYLMGTGVSEQRVAQLRMELPGVEITRRRGGFLGVICHSAQEDYCRVSEIIPGSGADDAGLRPRDIIVGIDGAKITRFEDLQRQINTHIPGDEIAIRFRRGGEELETKATLKKLENQ
jgi:S1-C subfamily serine protease